MNPAVIPHTQKTFNDVQVEEYEHSDWNFIFTKANMFNTGDLDMLQDLLTLQGIPDITNGHNSGLIYNKKQNFGFYVNAKDALYFCNFVARQNGLLDLKAAGKTTKINHISLIPAQAQLKHADKWKDKESAEIKMLEKISDTFYSTPYKGTITHGELINYQYQKFKELQNFKGKSIFETFFNEQQLKTELDYFNATFGQNKDHGFYSEFTEEEIPLHNLSPANPIQWASHIQLYEDELGDNGLSNCEFRFRVMNDCFFGLIRSYLRVDDVLIRILDTRVYHDFRWNYLLREFTHREDTWDNIGKTFQFTPQWSVDQNQSFLIQNNVKVESSVKEKIFFRKAE